ncbi:hypothetical protein QFC21_001483 [Naganishia friedmannii]|uniref:Uncharacterized protein n=1 Tax=Naganishia friedmannii TaxID=89922 RepID=A0ACC2W6S9_9TREE|nr:hypothetical protein QFC21_001483 [Naganishia friedmannii]
MSAFSLADDDIPMHHQPQNAQSQPQPHSAGSILVVGSMDRMNEYQHLLQTLRSRDPQASVQGEMVDRFLQNATTIPTTVTHAHVLTPTSSILPLLPYLPGSINVHFHIVSQNSTSMDKDLAQLHLELARNGWQKLAEGVEHLSAGKDIEILSYRSPLGGTASGNTTGASTPAHIDPSATTSLNGNGSLGGTMKLPKKSSKSRAQKASIWAAESPQLADPSSFLTDQDKVRPECVLPDPSTGRPQKRRRACKDCTCGLAELEASESTTGGNDNPTFLLEGDDDIPDHLRTAVAGVEGIWPVEKREEAKKTSSCGSCYLGDAFRCGSCPYLGADAHHCLLDGVGLPAFEPGQKVELLTNMDDI